MMKSLVRKVEEIMRILFLMIMVVASISQGADTVMSDSEGNIVEPAKSVFFKKNIQSFRQDVRIFVDTSPSPASDSMTSANYSRSNPFYYKENGSTTRTVNSSGITMATFSDYYQYYDMCWWSDGEIKGIDKWGNLIYFTSTIGLNFSEVKALHPEITDEAPTIYYWSTYYNSTGGCWGTKRQLTDFTRSIGFFNSAYRVMGIWIYPNYDSTQGRAVPVYKGAGVLDTTNFPKKGLGNNSNEANTKAGYRWVIWGEYVREVFLNEENTILVWRQTTNKGEMANGNKLWRPVRLEPYGEFKEVK